MDVRIENGIFLKTSFPPVWKLYQGGLWHMCDTVWEIITKMAKVQKSPSHLKDDLSEVTSV